MFESVRHGWGGVGMPRQQAGLATLLLRTLAAMLLVAVRASMGCLHLAGATRGSATVMAWCVQQRCHCPACACRRRPCAPSWRPNWMPRPRSCPPLSASWQPCSSSCWRSAAQAARQQLPRWSSCGGSWRWNGRGGRMQSAQQHMLAR